MVEDEDEAEGEDSHHVDGEGQQEEEEVAVVPPADAVVDPGAVVVKVLRAEKETQLLKQPFPVRGVPVRCQHTPPRSCHRRCSGSSVAACRSDRWRTTSSGPECP